MIFTSKILVFTAACSMGFTVVCAEEIPQRAVVRADSAFTIVGVDGWPRVSAGDRLTSLQVGESVRTSSQPAMAHLPDGRVAVAAAESEIHYLAIDAIGVSRGAGAVSFRSGARATLVLGGVAVHSIDPTQPSIVAADTVGSPALLLAGEHLSESQMRLGTANGPAMAVLTADGSNIVRMETGDSVVLARQEDGSGYLVVSTERDRFTPGAILLPDASNGGAAVVGGTGLGTTAATGVSALGLFALAAGGGFIFFGGDEEDSSGGTVEVPELAPSLPDSSPISVNKVNR